MLRETHLVLGAAAALPVAFELQPLPAAVAIAFGMAGGVFPDYVDLRSDARGLLRHRGASHGFVVNGLAIAGAFVMLRALSQLDDSRVRLDSSLVVPFTLAFAAGALSHLVSDACTHAGIRPLLPLSGIRLWLLPPPLRFSSKGVIDRLVRASGAIILIVTISLYLLLEIG
jgi:membrane-bound metal-dependent hydrolase YbcI (DUF457 family)